MERIFLCLVWILCLLPARALSEEQPRAKAVQQGDVIFETDFEGENALKGWSGAGRPVPGFNGSQSLFIERPAGSPRGSTGLPGVEA